MKKIAYVREKSRKFIFTLNEKISDYSLTIESLPDAVWEESDLGRLVSELDHNCMFALSGVDDLGRNMVETLELLAAIWASEASFLIVSVNLVVNPSLVKGPWDIFFLKIVEAERRRRSERTKAALALRKKAGVVLGTPPGPRSSKLDKHRKQIEKSIRMGTTQQFLAVKYKVTPATLSYWMKKNGLRRVR